jgi:hypothetical protein
LNEKLTLLAKINPLGKVTESRSAVAFVEVFQYTLVKLQMRTLSYVLEYKSTAATNRLCDPFAMRSITTGEDALKGGSLSIDATYGHIVHSTPLSTDVKYNE